MSESVSCFEVMLLEPLGLKNKHKKNVISFLATVMRTKQNKHVCSPLVNVLNQSKGPIKAGLITRIEQRLGFIWNN